MGQTSCMWDIVGDDVDVVHLATTRMPIPEFEPVSILPILVTGLALVFAATRANHLEKHILMLWESCDEASEDPACFLNALVPTTLETNLSSVL